MSDETELGELEVKVQGRCVPEMERFGGIPPSNVKK
jgi:hypothetical protein